MLAHVEARTTQLADREGRVPVERYTSQAQLERERAVLRQTPVAIAHVSELPRPGDFLSSDVAGVPVLVARGADGDVRAFANICRHRGTRLVTEACGHRKSFVCRYHAWTYGLDGALLHVPQADAFPSVRCEDTCLVALPSCVRHGFVWVTATPGLPCDPQLGPFGEALDAFGLAAHVVHRKAACVRQANWKLVIARAGTCARLRPCSTTDRCLFVHTMLIAGAAEQAHWDKTFDLIEGRVFQQEDLAIAESIQSTLGTPVDRAFRIGRLEQPICWFHDALDQATALP